MYMSRKVAGFSLIELLAASAIVGLLATVAVPFVETAVKRQKEQSLRIALRDIRQGIDAYKQAYASGRIKAVAGHSGFPPSLVDLVSGVDDVSISPSRKIYFLRRIPRDPFHPQGSVPALKTWGLRSYDSSDELPKEGDDVFDIYSTSAQTGLNGVPYREW